MTNHQLLVTHLDNLGYGGMPRWQATCSCGWAGGALGSESNADADAREHSLTDIRAKLAHAEQGHANTLVDLELAQSALATVTRERDALRDPEARANLGTAIDRAVAAEAKLAASETELEKWRATKSGRHENEAREQLGEVLRYYDSEVSSHGCVEVQCAVKALSDALADGDNVRGLLAASERNAAAMRVALAEECRNPSAEGSGGSNSACECCQIRWNLAADDLTGEAFRAKRTALSTTAGANLLTRHRAALESMRERAAKLVQDALAFSSVAPASRIADAIRNLPLTEGKP